MGRGVHIKEVTIVKNWNKCQPQVSSLHVQFPGRAFLVHCALSVAGQLELS